MWISVVVLIILVILGLVGLLSRDDGFINLGLWSLVISAIMAILIVLFSTTTLSTGEVGLVENMGGGYSGKVLKKTGINWFATAPSQSVKNVDIRNDKVSVPVNVMKDNSTNVSANIEVVYDLNPNRLVDLLSKNPNYKSTAISATVKQVVTSNNSLADSQSLTNEDIDHIENKLKSYGIIVTNVYMNSYKLTNSNNYMMNANVNNK